MHKLFFHREMPAKKNQFYYCICFTSFVLKSAASIYAFGLGNKRNINTSSALSDHTDILKNITKYTQQKNT